MEKTLILGKTEETEGRRRSGQQDKVVGWHPRLDGQELEQAPGDRGAWRAAVHTGRQRVGYDVVTERQLASSSQCCSFLGSDRSPPC